MKDITKNELKKYAEGSGFPEFRKFGGAIVREIYDDIVATILLYTSQDN